MAIPHIILFADANCGGNHTHVCESMLFIGEFNDVTSSFIILEGVWEFFADANYKNQLGSVFAQDESGVPHAFGQLGPGVYNWIEDPKALGPNSNDSLSSLKPV